MDIQTLLHEEIGDEFNKLKGMKVGSEEYETTINGLSKLVDKAIEIEKNEKEHVEKIACRESEQKLKQQQLNDEKKDRIVKNTISIAGIVIPVSVTIWGTLKSLKFEEEGTVTTLIGRGFINKLLPKK